MMKGKVAVIFRQLVDQQIGNYEQNGNESNKIPLTASAGRRSDIVIGSVDQCRAKDRQHPEKGRSAVFAQIGAASVKAVKDTHENTEAGMARDRGDSSYQRC